MLGGGDEAFDALAKGVGVVSGAGRPGGGGVEDGDPRPEAAHGDHRGKGLIDGYEAPLWVHIGEGEPFPGAGLGQVVVKRGVEAHRLKRELFQPAPHQRHRIGVVIGEVRNHGPELNPGISGLGHRPEVAESQGFIREKVG